MTSLRSTTAHIRHLAIAAFALALASLPARANEVIVNAGGTLPTAASLAASDTVTLNADINSVATMSFSTNKQPLTFRSGAAATGGWSTINGTTMNRLFQFTLETKTLTFDHLILQSGSIGNQGAGINFTTGTAGNITLKGVFALEKNYATGAGGGINCAANLEFTDAVSFTSNYAIGNGGGIQFGGGSVVFDDTVSFTGNYTGNQGGGINVGVSSVATFMAAALFTSNTAAINGGALHLHNNSAAGLVTFMQSATFLNNVSGNWGGAIDTFGALVFQNGAYFSGNLTGSTLAATATEGGGAIYSRGDVTIAGPSLFTSNTAGGNGGAIYMNTTGATGRTLTLDASLGDITFVNNTQNASTAPARNAIAISVGDTLTTPPSLILDTGAGPAAHTIALLDPINTVTTDATGSAFIVQNGDGVTLLDTFASAVVASTTINSGNFRLANNATYGASDTAGAFTLAATATLSGNGAIQAATLALADGAQLLAAPAETLTLRAANLATPNITFTGGGTLALQAAACAAPLAITANGAITANNTPITASLVNIGDPLIATSQTLTFAPTAPLTIANGGTLAFDLFAGNTSDLLIVNTLTLQPSGSACITTYGDIAGSYELIAAGADISTCNFFTQATGATLSFKNGGTELWLDLVLLNSMTRWTGAAAGGIWMNSLSTNLNWDNGAGDYSFINGDSVVFDDTATLKTVTIDINGVTASDMLVNNTAGNDYTIAGSGAITTDAAGDATATGKLTKTGAGALNFTNTGSNTFTGGIEISDGTIGITNGNQLGDGGNGIHFTDNATLRANADDITLANTLIIDATKTATIDTAANTLTFGGTTSVTSSGTLAKTGAGTLRLTTDNSAPATRTAIQQGTLSVETPAGKLGGNIDISANATLGGNGIITGTVNAAQNAIIAPGAALATSAVNLTINTLNLNSSILSFNLFADGSNDTLAITNALNAAGTNTINISAFQSGSYNLGNLAALAGTQVTINNFAQTTGARQKASVVAAPNATDLLLQATADISRILTWTGTTNTTWNPNDANWTDHAAVTLFANGDRVIFDTLATTSSTINIAGSGVTVSDLQIQGASNYTITGAGITADAASVITGTVLTPAAAQGKLLKTGSGTLSLQNAANTFLGGIDLAAGALTYTDPAQLGVGTTSINFTGNASLILISNLNLSATLANNITVTAGVTGTLNDGGGNLTLSGALSVAGWSGSSSIENPESKIENSSTLAKIGTGTLSLTGDSTAPDSANLTLALNQGAALLDNTTFAGQIAAAANTTIISASGATNNVTLRLAASSTLTGAGALAGATTLDGQVAASIAPSNTLAITGTVTGAGGFLKTGAGTLRLDGPDALGNTGPTQIDAGLLNYTGLTGTLAPLAQTITQAITLNGGTLALGALSTSTTAIYETATTAIWSNLAITQTPTDTTSAIRGNNDMIFVAGGTIATRLLYGLHIAVDAGDGNTTILANPANNFGGIVRIDSGTLQVTTTTGLGALGTVTTAKVALAGGALQISAPLTTSRAIDLRTDGIITVDDGIATQWNSITHAAGSAGYTPLATFTKAGSGTLTITANAGIASTNLTVAAGRLRYQGTPNALNTNATIAIATNAAFELANSATGAANAPIGYVGGTSAANLYYPSTSSTSSIAYTGGGALDITGGRIVFTSPNTTVANIAITGTNSAAILNSNLPLMNFAPDSTITLSDQGALVTAAIGTKLGNIVMNNGATLGFVMTTGAYNEACRTLTLATLTSTGAGNNLLFNTNLAFNQADHITITEAATGTFNIGIANWGAVPATYSSSLELLKAPDNTTATFVPLTPEIDCDLYKYTVSSTTGAAGNVSIRITGTGAMSNSAALINSVAAALPQTWFSELDSVTQRLGELHFENRDDKAGLSAWLRGYGERLNYNAKLTGSAFHETHYAGEAGVDYKIGGIPRNIYLGAYAGYGAAQRDLTATGDATSNSIYYGAYATLGTQSGWYLDLTAKFNRFKTNFTAISPTGERATADYNNWAIGGSLELGKRIDIGNGLFWEPQAQGALTNITGGTYQTTAAMTVTQLPATILRARAGLRFGYDIETATHGALSIYLKAYGGAQWVYDGQMNITTATGQTKRYSPVITGDYLEAGAGLAWRFAKATQIYLDYSTTDAAYYIKPWAINAGIRHLW